MTLRINHVLLSVLLLVGNLNQFSTYRFVKCPKQCTCDEDLQQVKCVNANMTSIPELPPNTTTLIFRGNKLNNLTSSTFENIVNLPLERLLLPRNDIRSISEEAFSGFKQLRTLDLSINKHIPVQDLVQALSTVQSNLTEIHLNTLALNDTSVNMVFNALSKFKVSSLFINRNKFKELNFTILNSTMPWLELLDGSFGNIRVIESWYMRNLKDLRLRNNFINLETYPFGKYPNCFFPSLEHLSLDSNMIPYLSFRFICLDKLRTLKLDRNAVVKIYNDTFSDLPSLESLTLSNLGNHVMLIGAHAFRNNRLRELDIRNNKFPFKDDPLYFRFDKDLIFKGLPNLRNLRMGGNYFTLDILTCMVSPLQRLQFLNLHSSYLGLMPTGLIYRLPNLYELDVSKNAIVDWDGNKVFSNKSIALTHLDLSFNAITAINESQFPRNTKDGLLQLDLSNNPFSCSCRNLWFTKWLSQNQSLFKGYPVNYVCKEPRDWLNKNLSGYRPTDSECSSDNTLFVTIVMSLSVVGIVFTIVVSLVYKARWHIRYWVYLLHFKRKGYTRMLEEKEKYKYDAFVVYSDGDRGWIYSKLCEQVEK